MDYKNTVEGKEVQKKYRDILYSSRPEIPPGHTRMDTTTGQRSSLLLRLSADTRKRSALKAGII